MHAGKLSKRLGDANKDLVGNRWLLHGKHHAVHLSSDKHDKQSIAALEGEDDGLQLLSNGVRKRLSRAPTAHEDPRNKVHTPCALSSRGARGTKTPVEGGHIPCVQQ